MRAILYTIAYDSADNLVLAVNAIKGVKYRCPECSGEMIPRRSIEQKKGAKRPHYAHKVLSPDCKPESVLHFGFKRLLSMRIQASLDKREPIPIEWTCSTCAREHQGNLLKKAATVSEEYSLAECRPDIVLLDANTQPVWALEVVVTHAPEEPVLAFYQKQRIALARFDLKSDVDLEKATALKLRPDHVDQCVNPRCGKCGRFKRNVVLWVIEAGCWKCGCVMPLAVVEGGESRGSTYVGPEHFTDDELALARAKGCTIRNHYSHTQHRGYLANTCNECGAFAGEHYLFTQYVAPAGFGELACEKIDAGYYCEHCPTNALLNGGWDEVEDDHDANKEVGTDQFEHRAEGIPEGQKAKEGFCIRCCTPIVRSRSKPLCEKCFGPYSLRERYGLPPKQDRRFCLRCGVNYPTTKWKPFCLSCFHIAGTRR